MRTHLTIWLEAIARTERIYSIIIQAADCVLDGLLVARSTPSIAFAYSSHIWSATGRQGKVRVPDVNNSCPSCQDLSWRWQFPNWRSHRVPKTLVARCPPSLKHDKQTEERPHYRMLSWWHRTCIGHWIPQHRWVSLVTFQSCLTLIFRITRFCHCPAPRLNARTFCKRNRNTQARCYRHRGYMQNTRWNCCKNWRKIRCSSE